MKKIIGIFDKNFVPEAFLSIKSGKILQDYAGLTQKEDIEDVINGIESKNDGSLSMRREHMDVVGGGIDIFMEEVLPTDKNYVFAVAERFGNAGFLAAVIWGDLKELFIELGKKELPAEERNKIWGKMINLDEDGAEALIKFAGQLRPIVRELDELDEKWKDFVHKKQIEIKDN